MLARHAVLFCAALALTGCAVYPSAGSAEADTPPQIVVRGDVRVWDNPGNFGPVTAERAETGAKVCASLDNDKVRHEARGYHSRALDLEGKPFVGGGYYCVPARRS